MSRCKHVWTVVEKVREKSPMERLINSGATSISNMSKEVLESFWLIHYKCNLCGTEKVEKV